MFKWHNSRHIQLSAGTLTLYNGVLYAQQRTAGSEQLVGQLENIPAGTLVLENYSVLGTPDHVVIQAAIVILRGNTVVRGITRCLTLLDERPIITAVNMLSWKSQVLVDGDSLDWGQATSDPGTKRWAAQLLAQLDQAKFGGLVVAAVNS